MTKIDLQQTTSAGSDTLPATSLIPSAAFVELPLGAIKPTGWLLEQLRLQGDGQTGHLEEIWADVGPNSAWLGGTGEAWERGPYYLDGLLPLAHVLDDAKLLEKANRWIEAIFSSQREDGFFGPASNNDWWPRMVVLKVLTQHFDATQDARVIPFMRRYFEHQLEHLPDRPLEGWGAARGAENILPVLWLFNQTHDSRLLELVDLILAQTIDWASYLTKNLARGTVREFSHFTHVVNVAMSLKLPALRFQRDGDPRHLETIHESLENLDALHGMVNGMFSGDEWLAGLGPERGVETCAVVEMMFSLEQLVRSFGESEFGDRLEQIAFNALPAAMGPDMRTHQYHQQINQVLCTIADRDWTMSTADANTFGLEPHFGCCTANLHQGWPKFVRALWMGTPSGGLAAIAYAPCRLSHTVAGVPVTLETFTDYPFKEHLEIVLTPERPVQFEVLLRAPAWCDAPEVRLNGQILEVEHMSTGFLRLEREWTAGDRIALVLPMQVRAHQRPRDAMALTLGPLTLAFAPGEVWERIPGSEGLGDFEVRFRRSWSYALALEPARANECRVERLSVPSPPFSHKTGSAPIGVEHVALRVHVSAELLNSWKLEQHSAAPPPQGLTGPLRAEHQIPLVPYGCARIRIAEFPVISRIPKDPT
jgi:Beta-L-arabinofuranosidase, GH127